MRCVFVWGGETGCSLTALSRGLISNTQQTVSLVIMRVFSLCTQHPFFSDIYQSLKPSRSSCSHYTTPHTYISHLQPRPKHHIHYSQTAMPLSSKLTRAKPPNTKSRRANPAPAGHGEDDALAVLLRRGECQRRLPAAVQQVRPFLV